MQSYDLVVIGSGPGGQRAAIQAAKSGKKVAVIEKRSTVGGVCINTGTIPSKTMREAVLHLSGFYYQNFYGANYHVKENVRMEDLIYRVQRVIENEVAVIHGQLQRNGVELMHGTGSFLDAHRIQVENGNGVNQLQAANVIIATGTKPAANPKVPVNGRTIINSDQILTMAQMPKTLIVGGRRSDRRRIRLHVCHAGRARHDCGKTSPVAGICRHRNGGSAGLQHARPPRDHAPE